MSGHSKWATIHRKKGLLDQQRGKVFQKLAKEIMVAAKGGSPDPNQNAALRLAVDKAKAQNMPKDNIQKAIEKATGGVDGANYETVRYEGYGHGGVAFMVDCLTDNRNRTASQVRSCFTKAGGNLGTDGSVSYLFERKGEAVTKKDILADVWGYEEDDNRVIDDLLKRLRKKLSDNKANISIETIRGIGYRLSDGKEKK